MRGMKCCFWMNRWLNTAWVLWHRPEPSNTTLFHTTSAFIFFPKDWVFCKYSVNKELVYIDTFSTIWNSLCVSVTLFLFRLLKTVKLWLHLHTHTQKISKAYWDVYRWRLSQRKPQSRDLNMASDVLYLDYFKKFNQLLTFKNQKFHIKL